MRWVLAAAYLLAGVLHLRSPEPFLAITPDWVPDPRAVIAVTGMCEIAGAIGMLVPRLRRLAGILLALYALCVFPANVKHAIDYITLGRGGLTLWYHVPRLLMQPVIVWWALFAGGVVDWPLRRHSYPRASLLR
ncbi:DoxX family protein [Sphingomonas panacis]|uniref:DoxX family protein n=1 Tax=Sphingomonas panacis TaxID=1560345 RepID=UPI001F0A9B7A|nr:DoxX family protein [Sphingomonas panacis]